MRLAVWAMRHYYWKIGVWFGFSSCLSVSALITALFEDFLLSWCEDCCQKNSGRCYALRFSTALRTRLRWYSAKSRSLQDVLGWCKGFFSSSCCRLRYLPSLLCRSAGCYCGWQTWQLGLFCCCWEPKNSCWTIFRPCDRLWGSSHLRFWPGWLGWRISLSSSRNSELSSYLCWTVISSCRAQ